MEEEEKDGNAPCSPIFMENGTPDATGLGAQARYNREWERGRLEREAERIRSTQADMEFEARREYEMQRQAREKDHFSVSNSLSSNSEDDSGDDSGSVYRSPKKCQPHGVADWTVSDVVEWLRTEQLCQFADAFEENEVDGAVLLDISDTNLKDDIGLTKLGPRRKVMSAIQQLKSKVQSNEVQDTPVSSPFTPVSTVTPKSSTGTPVDLRLKVAWSEGVEAISVPWDLSFDGLKSTFDEHYGDVDISYVDEDGDACVLRSARNWEDALSWARNEQKSAVRIQLTSPSGRTPRTPQLFPDTSWTIASSPPAAGVECSAGGPRSFPSEDVSRTVTLTDSEHVSTSMEDDPTALERLVEVASAGTSVSWKRGDEELGAGAFGRVVLGMDATSGQLIAAKEISFTKDDRIKVSRLADEVAMLSSLEHQNIVRYLGADIEPRAGSIVLAILMEYMPGGSISGLLRKFGPFGETVVVAYTRQILRGLVYLHTKRILHRDIKGANALVSNEGVVKLADFGTSRSIADLQGSGSGSLLVHTFCGTPWWMAPEVITKSSYGRKADIWSVGCTVHEMATGRPPFAEHPPITAIFQIGQSSHEVEAPEVLSETGRLFFSLTTRRDPAERPSAEELLEHPWLVS